MKLATGIAAVLLMLGTNVSIANSHGSGSHRYAPRTYHAPRAHNVRNTRAKSSRRTAGVSRGTRGRTKRSGRARNDFKRAHPCPSTGRSSGGCPGYVIDHVRALKHGGADTPGNMQWQTKAAAKAKDKVE